MSDQTVKEWAEGAAKEILMKPIRHGDVILRPVTAAQGKKEEVDEYTLAYGEVTGHHHTLYPLTEGALLMLYKDGDKRFLDLAEPWALRHQEHREIVVPPGLYEIGIEREYDPFERMMRKVVD